MSDTDGTVIWTRRVDEAAQRSRRNNYLTWFVAPAALVVVIAGLLTGGGALGLLILFAPIGLLLYAWVWANNLQLRLNRELRLLPDGRLVVGERAARRTLDLASVERWTTKMGTFRTSTATPTTPVGVTGTTPTAEVILRYADLTEDGRVGVRHDGGAAYRLEAFYWLQMPEEELAEVRAVLERHIDAPWVEPERLTE
jgi:hypothetical protein